jgi:transcriptional regulator with XRE-family HTH domain
VSRKPKVEIAARDAERARNLVFATNLQRLMREHGLTTRDLGSAIRMSHQGISQWLGAQNGPSNRRLAQLANFFGVNVHRLLSAPVVAGSKVAAGTVPINEVDPNIAASGLELEFPGTDANEANTVRWRVPPCALGESISNDPKLVVVRVGHHDLEPDVQAGDYIFADVACRTVFRPGIYLLVIAGLPAWRRCEPLVGESVLVSHGPNKQEVLTKDLHVLGRAVRVLTEP